MRSATFVGEGFAAHQGLRRDPAGEHVLDQGLVDVGRQLAAIDGKVERRLDQPAARPQEGGAEGVDHVGMHCPCGGEEREHLAANVPLEFFSVILNAWPRLREAATP